jgi:beta-glucosidase
MKTLATALGRMQIQKFSAVASVLVLTLGAANGIEMRSAVAQTKTQEPPYVNRDLSVEERVKDLLGRMTLEEKVAQLQSTLSGPKGQKLIPPEGLGGIGPMLRPLTADQAAERANTIQTMAFRETRLGIPVMIHDEALHGILANKATSFPQAIALASTWDTDLMSRVATVIGKETRSRGIRQVLSPVINIARDVRWGRVEETYGEDPYLTSRMGVAFCSAIERQGVATTPKHFVANVGDGGRDSYPIEFSERSLREVYFPPFKACVQEGHASSVMAAYNSLDGLPCSADPYLLTDILRKEWGFGGFVVSDYGSAAGIMNKHFVAATEKGAATLAVSAGLDVELPSIYVYGKPLIDAVNERLLPISALNEAVRHVLRVKFRLGMFEERYVDPKAAAATNDAAEHRALAREAARKAIVLLKNERNILPLKKSLKSIAVIGPAADEVQLGGYSGYGMKTVSLLEGLKGAVTPATKLLYAKGCEVGFTALPTIPSEALYPPGAKPGEHGLRGEYFSNMTLSGPPVLVRTDKQVYFEWAMGSPDSSIPVDHFSVRWTGKIIPPVSGVYKLGASTDDGLRLYLDGKLLIDSWFVRGATLDYVEVRLEAGHAYDLKMEYYENDGWAYANLVWDVKDRPNPLLQAALDSAKHADVALVAVRIIEGEGYDRASLDLPGSEEELINAVAATGTPTIVILVDGNAVSMSAWKENVAGILQAWYGGEEAGNGLMDVLFGDENPGGKLPITFPQFAGQCPLYYDHKPTGRGDDYSDMSGKPLFPFGFGLSYTTFEYVNLKIEPLSITPKGSVSVSVNIRNTGNTRGDEVVQLYLHDQIASVTRPGKELKGFSRLSIEPGETRTVRFTIGPDELTFFNRNLKPVVEPGEVMVMVGSSSEDIRATGTFQIAKP